VRFRTLLLAALIGLGSFSVAQAKKQPKYSQGHYKKPKKFKRGKFKTPKQQKMKKAKWRAKR
jgi:hypothetical protein